MARFLTIISILVLILFVGVSIFSPWVSTQSPYKQYLTKRLKPPNKTNIMGTDELGRDVFSRLIYGSRVSLLISVASVILTMSLGTVLGLISGYYRKTIGKIIDQLTDAQLAFPPILLAISIGVAIGPGIITVILVLTLTNWPIFTRVVRAQTLEIKEKEFVTGSIAMGSKTPRTIIKHIVPNILSGIIVLATIILGRMILLEAALSFLGLGIKPPLPSWGQMIYRGQAYLSVAWWIATFPGIATSLIVVATNILGDTMRDRFRTGFGQQ